MRPVMRTSLVAALLGAALASGCGSRVAPVTLTEDWPATIADYDDVTSQWTRSARMRGEYQEALEVVATFKSSEWRAAHAEKDANSRGLEGNARSQQVSQARADAAGPYEFEVMLTTWDRRENDLDRGVKSTWKVRMMDEQGVEIEPLEVVKDKRPAFVVRSEFPALGDFATAYIVRFPRTKPLLGPGVKEMRMHLSSERGGADLRWTSR